MSCTKNSKSPTTIFIHYIDSAGNDLFTNGQNGYKQDSVRIFSLENGVKTLVYFPTISFPFGYTFDDPQIYGHGVIRILPYNTSVVNGYITSIIRLKQNVEDTIKCQLVSGSTESYDAVWYNGVLANFGTPHDIKK